MSAAVPPILLLVEDNPDDVLLLRRALRKCRTAVLLRVAEDGDQALGRLQAALAGTGGEREPLPALVLLDWKLPRRSGHEVLCWIRARPELDALPVVVFTSSAEPADVRAATAARANSYLQKPSTADALALLLEATLDYWLNHHIRPGEPTSNP
ncbi:response regulator [Caldimonas tepidiphila]|uniref:response regulator n=1 Tax=Caldimonas tepidiphila TaxID=2315841 RepID=UPI001F0C93B5|nr:response regulator [Caldimonas tepidiphila]